MSWFWSFRRHPRIVALVLIALVLGIGVGGAHRFALYHWHKAQAAVKAGRLAEARDSLHVCLHLWPRGPTTHVLAARAARLGGDFSGAEEHLNRCLRLQGGASAEVQLEFLLMRAQTGEVEDVAPALMATVDQQHPESGLILETIARAYIHNLRYEPALAALVRWSDVDPGAAQAWLLRGWVLEQLKDEENALHHYARALELDSDLVAARLRLAELHLERNKPQEALPHLNELRARYPDRADVLARLGQCRLMQGQKEAARPLLEQAVRTLPDDPILLLNLAKIDLADDRPAEAEKWLRHMLELDATDVEAQYKLVEALRLQGREDEAVEMLARHERDRQRLKSLGDLLREEALMGSPDANREHAVGDLFLTIGQERLGLHWLNLALERDPRHKATHRLLADFYEKKGESDRAETHRRRADEAGKSPSQ